MPAIPVHHTAVVDEAWDGPAAVAAMPNDHATLNYCHAWETADAADQKADYKFPHHAKKAGPANLAACRNGLARLSNADIPDGDRAGVKAHLQAHLDDAPKKTSTARPSLAVLREHRGDWRGRHERRRQASQFELRAKPNGTGGTAYSFDGYAAVFDSPFEMWDAWGDPYAEVLAGGSCARTLGNNADVQFLIGHNEASIPLARTKSGTMSLSADDHGLHVSVPSLDGRSPIVQSLASAMERGDMDEMSIGFIATQQQWSSDWMERHLLEINLNRGDVSVVCWAANPAAAGASMAALPISEAAARALGAREIRTPTAPYSAKAGEGNECPQCHSMNDGDAAYCDQCGTAVRSSGQSTADENETQRCSCGSWNADDAKFCDQCGTNISSDLDADNGGAGNGSTMAQDTGWWARQNPAAEQRASADLGLTGDPETGFSGDSAPDYDPSQHGPGSPTCPGCSAANSLDAKFCDQCGQGLYDNDALIADPLSWAMQARVRVLALRR